MNFIKITGAKVHNLKNIDIEIPRNKITCFVGVSGSGKSTIATDIVAAEGQRQYLESLSTFATRFLRKKDRPDVDRIEGLSSTILVEQKQMHGSPRSTVGTTTEIYTYLRLLFSRVGTKKLSAGHFSFNNPKGACKTCKGTGIDVTVDIEALVNPNKTLEEGAINHPNYCRPDTRMMNILKTTGKVPFDVPLKDLTQEQLHFLLYISHTTLKNAEQGFVQSYSWEGIVPRIIKRTKDLRGISKTKEKSEGNLRKATICETCNGARLNEVALTSTINENNIGYYANLPITKLIDAVRAIKEPLATNIIDKMEQQLQALIDVGVGYVSLNRSVNTLSGGEAQRVKLARELGVDLIETIYVLDEPTAGLHAKDTNNLVEILKRIRDRQNTVIVVEHDEAVMKGSDQIIEIGPGAGRFGGELVCFGTPEQVTANDKSLTGQYLSGVKRTSIPSKERKPVGALEIKNANLHNLKDISVNIPTGIFTAITGVSGSGKSTLINDIFVKKYSNEVVFVDQSQIGASPRGCSATYVRAFDYIRDIFAKENNVSKALFSSNSTGGCPDCKGLGYKKIDMHFMADMKLECETCGGQKYTPEVLAYKYKGKNIAEVLEMTANEALTFFEHKEVLKRLQMLSDVGLDYLALGQTLDTLSGGESQRLKLASRLHEKGSFYVLDEPTSGLHFFDIEKLLILLHKLVDAGNTVLVIEHNLDVIKSADWVIDLGPEGGDGGGEVVAEGTPKEVARVAESYTGQFLKEML